ncbi:PucR family transcriptional regulator, partial [Mycobacteroides abscessus]|uniref:PucR family transcriptional regulator n=1 Tax=Mycobacteroides abscessus TaxID=36809 RepID=UPI0039EF00A1
PRRERPAGTRPRRSGSSGTTATSTEAGRAAAETPASGGGGGPAPPPPPPVSSRELLPERALLGDKAAIAALNTEVMRPLADAGPALTETLDAYLDSGGAIEACARALFVHPNTVRYRLKRITDFTGRDPTSPRDAYVLRVAATVGRLAQDHADAFTPEPGVTPVTINVIKT